MIGFKPQLSINGIPRQDDFITIWTDPNIPQVKHPQVSGSDSDYIILTGLDKDSMAELTDEVNKRGQEISTFCRTHYPKGSWDVMIKPIIWMETLESALDFLNFVSVLDEGDQSEIITDIQLEFNEPWGMVDQITDLIWDELKMNYSFKIDQS